MNIDESKYKITQHEDGRIEAVPIKNKRWVPEISEGYTIVYNDGELGHVSNFNLRSDNMCVALGNAYHPDTDMEWVKRRLHRAQMMINIASNIECFEPDWGNEEQEKWGVYFNHLDDLWLTWRRRVADESIVYFSTEKKAKQAAAMLQEEMPNREQR